jgi:hypothetical protein
LDIPDDIPEHLDVPDEIAEHLDIPEDNPDYQQESREADHVDVLFQQLYHDPHASEYRSSQPAAEIDIEGVEFDEFGDIENFDDIIVFPEGSEYFDPADEDTLANTTANEMDGSEHLFDVVEHEKEEGEITSSEDIEEDSEQDQETRTERIYGVVRLPRFYYQASSDEALAFNDVGMHIFTQMSGGKDFKIPGAVEKIRSITRKYEVK